MLISSGRNVFSTGFSGFFFLFSRITFSLEELSQFSVMSQVFFFTPAAFGSVECSHMGKRFSHVLSKKMFLCHHRKKKKSLLKIVDLNFFSPINTSVSNYNVVNIHFLILAFKYMHWLL